MTKSYRATLSHAIDRLLEPAQGLLVRLWAAMSLTNRQQEILGRVRAVEVRIKRSGRHGYRLEGDDVTATIFSLIVRDLVTKEAGGLRIALTKAGRSALGGFAA